MLKRVVAGPIAVLLLAACASGGGKAGRNVASPAGTTTPTAATATTETTETTRPATLPITTRLTPPTAPATSAAPTPGRPATTAVPAPGTAAPPATSTTAPAVVHLTAADNARTVDVPDGATVIVDLSSGELWSEPASSDSAVLNRTSGSVNASNGDATATFSAVGKGAAKVTSTHRCLPQPGAVCAMYVAVWSATVTVT